MIMISYYGATMKQLCKSNIGELTSGCKLKSYIDDVSRRNILFSDVTKQFTSLISVAIVTYTAVNSLRIIPLLPIFTYNFF